MSFVSSVGILILVMLIFAVAITVIVVVNKKKKALAEAAHAQMSYESKTLYHGSEKKVGITGILVALLIVYIVITDFVVPAMNPPATKLPEETIAEVPQCDIPEITTPNGVEIEQGNGLTLTWNPPASPAQGVEYFIAVMQVGKENETYTNVTSKWISALTYEIDSRYFTNAGAYVVTLYAKAQNYLQVQASINVLVDNSYFGFHFKEDYPIEVLVDRDGLSVAPYAYVDTSLFANKKILQIDVPVGSVSAVDENQYFTLWVVNSAMIREGANVMDASYRQYKIYIPVDEITDTEVNKWISIDVSALDIYVGANETLAFMKWDDPVICCFRMEPDYAFGYDLANKGIIQFTHSIYYGVKTESWDGKR